MSILIHGILSQASEPPSLSISPTSASVNYNAGNTSFGISSNVSWTAEERTAYAWLSLNKESGSNNDTITATYTKNTSSSSRTAYIDVKSSGLSTKTFTLTQSGCPNPTCNVVLCPEDQGYIEDVSCVVTKGSDTITFSFTPKNVTGGNTIYGFSFVSGSQGGGGRVYFQDNTESNGSVTLTNDVQCGENYTITVCTTLA